jgi:inorganic triphosphatase YgiF
MQCIISKKEGGNFVATELEWKFAASEEAFSALEKAYEEALFPITMETTYYDTPDRFFSSRRCTLRARLENGKSICTLKAPAKKGRAEWEVEMPRIEEAATILCNLAGFPAPETLVPVCGAKFIRLAANIQLGTASVELALDRGILLGGDKQLPLLEVETEYKGGEEATAEAFAYNLAKEYGLTPEKKSKFRRAMDLATE